jgi:gluconokinase
MVVVLIGVSGSGKTTVGKLLADQLGWPFYEGDDFHPRANVDKMSRGVPLDDGDRLPWLDNLHRLIERSIAAGDDAVLACSALKRSYREQLAGELPGVRFVFLRASPELLRQRLENRRGHFMKADLLGSQLETLEEPRDAVVVNAALTPDEIVGRIRNELHL